MADPLAALRKATLAQQQLREAVTEHAASLSKPDGAAAAGPGTEAQGQSPGRAHDHGRPA